MPQMFVINAWNFDKMIVYKRTMVGKENVDGK